MPKRAAPKAEAASPIPKKQKAEDKAPAAASSAQVDIVSSKACQAFARTTNTLKAAILKRKPGVTFHVDEQKKISSKPDKGSFVVSVHGKALVELIALPRPFTKMKELDLEKLADDVCSHLK